MQSMDVISLNIWHILIALCNLVILFLILKHFLYRPVKAMLAQRQAQLAERYETAQKAEQQALQQQQEWTQKMQQAQQQAEAVIQSASETAERRGAQIVDDAKGRAEDLIRRAQDEVRLEREKAADEIKHEIVDASVVLAEKMLQREIHPDDHRELIDSFVQQIGEQNDTDQ